MVLLYLATAVTGAGISILSFGTESWLSALVIAPLGGSLYAAAVAGATARGLHPCGLQGQRLRSEFLPF